MNGPKPKPKPGSNWINDKGIPYQVVAIANTANINPKYPPAVIYTGPHGNVWTKDLAHWHDKMKEVVP